MTASDPAAFHDHFQDLNDPRVERTRKHPLINIVFIAVCGVLSGANSFAAIQEFGLDRRTWFARYLDLTNGIPSDDTFARVLARLDPAAFEKCLLSWVQAVQEVTEHRLIAIDGKTLRGSYDRRDGKAAIHMVSAWAIGEQAVARPGGRGREVQRDHGDPRVAPVAGRLRGVGDDRRDGLPEGDRRVDPRGGGRLRPGRQAEPADAVRAGRGGDRRRAGAGRRRSWTSTRRSRRATAARRRGRMRSSRPRRRSIRTGCGGTSARWGWRSRRAPIRRAAVAWRPATTSSACSCPRSEFADAVRGHWGIENNLHWQLDVSFREDECRVRTRSCPGEPECDPAVRPGAAEARDQLPARDRDQATEVRRER